MSLRLAVVALLCAAACGKGDECHLGAARCFVHQDFVEAQACINSCSDFGCRNLWTGEDVCSPSRTCLLVESAGAICALSTTPDPRCAGVNSFCDGDDRVFCRAGYGVSRSSCILDLPRCVATGTGDAACIPSAAAPDPRCPAGRSRYCSAASDLVECLGGDVVFRSRCRTCNASGSCSGFLGDTCVADADCASGLLCHADALGRTVCTATCTITATGDDCLQALGTDGLPYSSYAELKPPGRQLLCAAGYCTWQ